MLCIAVGSAANYLKFTFVNFFFVEDLRFVFFAFIVAAFEYSFIVTIIALFFVCYFSSTFLK